MHEVEEKRRDKETEADRLESLHVTEPRLPVFGTAGPSTMTMDPRDLKTINELFEGEAKLREVNESCLSYRDITKSSNAQFTQRIRERAAEFEKETRVMTSMLDKIHSTPRSESADVSQ
jgi:hypothetical protein